MLARNVLSLVQFQSTRPCERATSTTGRWSMTARCFNPRTRVKARLLPTEMPCWFS